MQERHLNADAIYAALVWMRDVSDHEKLNSSLHEILGCKAPVGQVPTPRPPRFDFPPELVEQIYPGERASVEVGLDIARWLIYCPGLLAIIAKSQIEFDGPVSQALRRFLAENARAGLSGH